MGIKITKAKMLPIGVDIGSSCVKLVQMRVQEDQVELTGAATIPIPRELRSDPLKRLGWISPELRKLVKRGIFKGAHAVLSLPAEATFVHHVRIPKVPLPETDRAVRAELASKLPFPVEQAEIRYIIAGDLLGEREGKQEVITVSAPRATLDAYIDAATKAKLDVACINVEPCAITECFARLFRRNTDGARTILYLDIGAASTQVVLAHGQTIVFARNLRCGSDRFDTVLAEALDTTPDDAARLRRAAHEPDAAATPEAAAKAATDAEDLYRILEEPVREICTEITQCLRYYESVFRNHAIERAIFLGGEAHDKRLCQRIARALNLPAQVGDPLMRVVRAPDAVAAAGLDQRDPQPEWAVAVGLSLGAVDAA